MPKYVGAIYVNVIHWRQLIVTTMSVFIVEKSVIKCSLSALSPYCPQRKRLRLVNVDFHNSYELLNISHAHNIRNVIAVTISF